MKAYRKVDVDDIFSNRVSDLEQLDTIDVVDISTVRTNGDTIKAMFPELKLSTTDGKVFVRNKGEEYLQMCFSWKWWNMPYNTEKE